MAGVWFFINFVFCKWSVSLNIMNSLESKLNEKNAVIYFESQILFLWFANSITSVMFSQIHGSSKSSNDDQSSRIQRSVKEKPAGMVQCMWPS